MNIPTYYLEKDFLIIQLVFINENTHRKCGGKHLTIIKRSSVYLKNHNLIHLLSIYIFIFEQNTYFISYHCKYFAWLYW